MSAQALPRFDLLSGRLHIRSYKQTDARALFELIDKNREMISDPMPLTSSGNKTVMQVRAFIVSRNNDRQAGVKSFAGIFLKKSGQLIGQIALVSYDARVPRGEIGYFIDASQQNKGYATEAVKTLLHFLFTEMKLEKAMLRIEPANTASSAIAQKCGFTQCGFLRNDFRALNGRLMNINEWELLRDEFRL